MPTRKTESAVKTLSIAVGHDTVSGLIESPGHPLAAFVFAHGAGAGMTHPFMAKVAHGLAERGIATLRFNFSAMEQGRRRPDTPATAHATVRAAAAAAAEWWPSLPLIAGGKSFGGRMTSQAQAAQPIPGVVGLLFLGFPLHPQKKPSTDRAAHLSDVAIPMLFLQGAADALADMALIEPVVAALGARATLKSIPAADHSFHVPARSGRTDDDVLTELHDTIHAWTIGLTRHG